MRGWESEGALKTRRESEMQNDLQKRLPVNSLKNPRG